MVCGITKGVANGMESGVADEVVVGVAFGWGVEVTSLAGGSTLENNLGECTA